MKADRAPARRGSRASRRILWLAAVGVVPVPLLVVGPGLVPAGRLLELGGASLAVLVVESSRGVVGLLAALLLGQGLAWVGVFWLAARGAGAALSRTRRPLPLALAVVALGVAVASGFEVYETPFAAERPRATLLSVYR